MVRGATAGQFSETKRSVHLRLRARTAYNGRPDYWVKNSRFLNNFGLNPAGWIAHLVELRFLNDQTGYRFFVRGRGVYARRGRAFFVGAIYFVLDSGRLRDPNLKFKPLVQHYAGGVLRQ